MLTFDDIRKSTVTESYEQTRKNNNCKGDTCLYIHTHTISYSYVCTHKYTNDEVSIENVLIYK